MAEGKIRIKLVRSTICTPQRHKNIVKSLGLHTLNRTVERPDTPGFRGMVAKVPHLLQIVDESRTTGSKRSVRSDEPRTTGPDGPVRSEE